MQPENQTNPDAMTALRLLVIEDNPGDAALVQACTREGPLEGCRVVVAGTVGEALDLLRRQPFDVILLDYRLPDMDGLEALKLFRAQGIDTPVIVLTGLTDPRIAAELIKEGAQDYLSKNELLTTALPRSVRGVHEHAGLMRRVRQSEEREQKVVSAAEALRHRNRELSVVSAISSAGGPGVQPRQFIERCLDVLDRELEVESLFVALRAGDLLEVAAERNLPDDARRRLREESARLIDLLGRTSNGLSLPWAEMADGRSGLLVPLVWQQGGVFGVLGVLPGSHVPRLGPIDEALLATAAQQMALALENIQHVRQLRQQVRLQAELDLAQSVQSELLPARGVCVGRLCAVGTTHQAEAVGGDYYDFMPVGKDRMAVVLGDASGKGFSAALIIAMVAAAMDSLARSRTPPDQALGVVNAFLSGRLATSRFVTAFYGVWDGATATLTAANAGQVPPRWVHVADGAMETLTEAGPALGFVDEGEGLWPAYSITLAPGDCLCLMSDGLSAMMESAGCPELADETIRRVVVEHADRPLHELAEAFDEHVAARLSRSPQQDDVTVVFLRREK